MEENLLTITVNIAERNYSIRIRREDEEEIRKAAKLLNDAVLEFKQKYPAGVDSKISLIDYMSMAAMQIAVKYTHLNAQNDMDLFADELKNIGEDLDNILKSDEE